ncbi:hypothetical protein CASFOL_014067 [Castilleja foliolosa]|uniref:Uncharacterized protein n=1 Tax=Castilleja foliolosa TaxID=1961234 RepID=A0ABD3DNM6_9LAMI
MNNRFNNHQFAGELEDTEYSPENSGGDSPCSAVSPPILHPLSGGGVAVDQGLGNCHNNYLLSELMLMSNCPSKIRDDEDEEIEKMKLEQHLSYAATAVSDPAHSFLTHSNFPNNQILQGIVNHI